MSTYVYLFDQDGEGGLASGTLRGLGPEHKTPGMGIGRECHGFYIRLDLLFEGRLSELSAQQAAPLRVKLWDPEAPEKWCWLVHPSTPRNEIDRLRELMWPTALLP